MINIFENYQTFLDQTYDGLGALDLDVTGLVLDHVGYQTNSKEDYESKRTELLKTVILKSENVVGGRRVGIFQLNEPLKYKEQIINAVELVEPKEGQICESRLDHTEFVTPKTFDEMMNQYPNINWDTSAKDRPEFAKLQLRLNNGLGVKFHKTHIFDEIPKTN